MIIDKIQAEMQARSELSINQLNSQIDVLDQQETDLSSELEDQQLETQQIGISSFEMESLKQEVDQLNEVSLRIAEEIQKINIELESPSRITLHRRAEVPVEPEMRRKYMMTAFAGLGVLALIVGGVVWLESTARRISSMGDVSDGLSLPIMGSLPVMPNWIVQGKEGRRKNGRSAVWQSVWTESVDSARTMMLRDADIEDRQVIMIASAMGGEGKTTLSSHLATSLAKAGRNTLLIDCDLRRPNIHKMFGIEPVPGMCELLRGEFELEDIVQTVEPNGLNVIPAGRLTQAALQQLSQGGMKEIIDQARLDYDFVIVDSSPVLPVTDAMLVGQHVDAVIFSIRRDVSRYNKVAGACQRFSMLGIPILGAVVIGLDEGSYGSMYPQKYGYGRNYHSYYSYHAPPDEPAPEPTQPEDHFTPANDETV